MINENIVNTSFVNKSISIILKQFKNNHITEEETIQLIEDLYRHNNISYVPYWPQITYHDNFPKYEITCKQ